MLTELRIKNFKSWQDTGDLRLAPLTVFSAPTAQAKVAWGSSCYC